jgi:recombinational DNA repair protein RecR
MKSKRKPNNGFARAERSCQALLRTNHVAVVNIDPSGSQIMANWKSCKQIRSLAIANAIYIGAMCRDERGGEYIKSVEISPEGIYKVERLTDAIEHYYLELRNSANPAHLVASGWIAIPDEISMDEAQAAKLFYAAGAWHQVKVAA